MANASLTELETWVLSAFHARYASFGFPDPARFDVLSRENTGAGRYTKISSEALVELPDGYHYLPNCYIQIDELSDGASQRSLS